MGHAAVSGLYPIHFILPGVDTVRHDSTLVHQTKVFVQVSFRIEFRVEFFRNLILLFGFVKVGLDR